MKQRTGIKTMFLILITAALLTSNVNALMVMKVNSTERLAVDYNVPVYGAWYFDQELVLNNTHNMIIPPCDSANDSFCTDPNLIWGNTTIVPVPVCDNATWCFDPNSAFEGKTPRFHQEIVYSPNASIGYHNITFRGVPLMGVPYENIHNFEIFVGTLFVANESVAVNAATSSMLVEPTGTYNMTTFVENVTGVFVPWQGENAQIQFKVSSAFFNLTNISFHTGKELPFGNGLIYSFPFNTVGKNGTFLVSLDACAETIGGKRINVSTQQGEVKIYPDVDVNGNGQIKDSVDVSLVRQFALANNRKGTNLSDCPNIYCERSNFIKDNIVNDSDYRYYLYNVTPAPVPVVS